MPPTLAEIGNNMTPEEAIQLLKDAGYAVAVWTPEEVGGADIGLLEDVVIERGNDYLECMK
jgi:hypothetical protein